MKIEYRGHEVRIATGGKSHADSDGPAVVLIHGAGMDRTTWQMQNRWLSHHGYRVAAIDLPGHGLSAGSPLTTIEDMADWTAGLIHELDLVPAHVVGFSLGTFVALEVGARHPEVTASLILIGTAAAMPVHPDLLTASSDDVDHASQLMTSWALGSKAHRGGHPSPGTWVVGASKALIGTSPAGALAADMDACNGYGGAVEAAGKIEAPVTFVLGTEDKMTPMRKAQELIDAVANSKVIVCDSIGHMMPIEDPIGARRAIAEALGWDGTRG